MVRATASCELSGWRRAEDLLKIATLGEEGGRRWEGDGEARPGAPAWRRLGGAGGKGGRAADGSAGPGAGDPQAREPPAGGNEECGDTWARGRGAGKGAREAAGPREPPRVERRRARGWTGDYSQGKDWVPERTWVSQANDAHARRKVMVGRSALLLRGSSAARGRDPGRCQREPGRHRARPRSRSPGGSGARLAEPGGPQLRHFVLREGRVVGRYLEGPHIRLQLKESFKGILKENATFRGF